MAELRSRSCTKLFRSVFPLALAALLATGCADKGEPANEAELANVHEGMSYEALVAAIGGTPREANSGSTPDGQSVATYVSPHETKNGNVQFMFRDGRLFRIVRVGHEP